MAEGMLPEGWSNSGIQSQEQFLRIPPDQIEIGDKLGEGSFGVVFEAVWHRPEQGDMKVAVKQLKCTLRNNDPEVAEFMCELALMSRLSHPNIVKMLGAGMAEDGASMMITELVCRGNLFQALHIQRRKMKVDWLLKFCFQIAAGMAYLHSQSVIHRDLKSLNLLVAADWTLKVCDFGLSRAREADSAVAMTAQIGTAAWMAPELISGRKYTEKVDVYSFGMVVYEMASNEIPFRGMSAVQVSHAVANEDLRPVLPPACPTPVKQLIEQCWAKEQKSRPAFSTILKMMVALQGQSVDVLNVASLPNPAELGVDTSDYCIEKRDQSAKDAGAAAEEEMNGTAVSPSNLCIKTTENVQYADTRQSMPPGADTPKHMPAGCSVLEELEEVFNSGSLENSQPLDSYPSDVESEQYAERIQAEETAALLEAPELLALLDHMSPELLEEEALHRAAGEAADSAKEGSTDANAAAALRECDDSGSDSSDVSDMPPLDMLAAGGNAPQSAMTAVSAEEGAGGEGLPEGWQELKCPNTGAPYYHNTRTNEVSWLSPAALSEPNVQSREEAAPSEAPLDPVMLALQAGAAERDVEYQQLALHLVGMGFKIEQSKQALEACDGDVEAAAAQLVGSVRPGSKPTETWASLQADFGEVSAEPVGDDATLNEAAVQELAAMCNNVAVLELVAMGFEKDVAIGALGRNHNSLEHAVLDLIGGSGTPPSSTVSPEQPLAIAAEPWGEPQELPNSPSAPPMSTAPQRSTGYVQMQVPVAPGRVNVQSCWACGTSIQLEEGTQFTCCDVCGTITTITNKDAEALPTLLNQF